MEWGSDGVVKWREEEPRITRMEGGAKSFQRFSSSWAGEAGSLSALGVLCERPFLSSLCALSVLCGFFLKSWREVMAENT